MSLWRPGHLRPMLAEAARDPFDSPEHLFEPKWDGFRCLAFLDRHAFPERGLMLQSRNGADLTPRFPHLAYLGQGPWRRTILDGELVAWYRGRADFHRLIRRESAGDPGTVVLVAFDLLMESGEELIHAPLLERRRRLLRLVEAAGVPGLLACPAVPGQGIALFQAAVQAGLEGVVAKRMESPYRPGQRSRDWLKVRRVQEMDCVIGGVAPGRIGGLGAFLVGAYASPEERELRYLGRVGSGVSREEATRVLARLRPRLRPPFTSLPPVPQGTLWVEPEVVCRVAYREITPSGLLRQPVYRGLREDKAPEECLLPFP